jgi:hypothetical protein
MLGTRENAWDLDFVVGKIDFKRLIIIMVIGFGLNEN